MRSFARPGCLFRTSLVAFAMLCVAQTARAEDDDTTEDERAILEDGAAPAKGATPPRGSTSAKGSAAPASAKGSGKGSGSASAAASASASSDDPQDDLGDITDPAAQASGSGSDAGSDGTPRKRPAKNATGEILLPASPLALGPAETPWTFEQWYAEALTTSPLLCEAKEDAVGAVAKLMEATWARFPRMDWQSSIVPVPTLAGSVSMQLTFVNGFAGFSGLFQQHKVELYLPLFTFGKLRAQRRVAKAGVEVANTGEAAARETMRLELRRAFDTVKVGKVLLSLLHQAAVHLSRADKKLDEYLEAGTNDADELDRNRFATLAADLQSQAAEAHKFDLLARFTLRNAAGITDERAEVRVVGVDPSPLVARTLDVPPLPTLIAAARKDRPDYRQAAAKAFVKQAELDAAEAAYYPDFFATGTVGVNRCNVCTDQTNPFVFDQLNLDLWSASVGVRLGLDYGLKVARARQAAANFRRAEAERLRAANAVELEVHEAYLKWKQAVANAAVTERARRAADDWREKAEARFFAGKARAADLAEGLLQWLRFRQDQARVAFNINMAVATLEKAVGRSLAGAR